MLFLCLIGYTLLLVRYYDMIIVLLTKGLLNILIEMDFLTKFELFCSISSLATAVIIAYVQYKQSEKMSKFEQKIDERDERRHCEEVKAQAVAFISKHYKDKRIIPLCAIAAMYNDMFYYTRDIYREFCCFTRETQNKILEYCEIDLKVQEEPEFYTRCIDVVKKTIRARFPNDIDIFYENGKYVLRCLDIYGSTKPPLTKITYYRYSNVRFIQSYFQNNPEVQYQIPIRDILKDAFKKENYQNPIEILSSKYEFQNTQECCACQFATTVMSYIAIFAKQENPNKNYGCPDEQFLEQQEEINMEDIFLLALYNVYINLIL